MTDFTLYMLNTLQYTKYFFFFNDVDQLLQIDSSLRVGQIRVSLHYECVNVMQKVKSLD